MTRLLIVLLAAILFNSCTASKNASHISDNASIVIPEQDYYYKSNEAFQRGWDEFNALDDPTYY